MLLLMVVYMLAVGLTSVLFLGGWHYGSWTSADEYEVFALFRSDVAGVALMYSSGGFVLIMGA